MLVNYCVQVGNYVVNQHKIVTRNNKEIVRGEMQPDLKAIPQRSFLSWQIWEFPCHQLISEHTELVANRNLVCGCTDDGCAGPMLCLSSGGWAGAALVAEKRQTPTNLIQFHNFFTCAVSQCLSNLFNRHAACVPPDRWKVNKTGQKFSLDQLQYFHEMYRLYRIYSVYSFNYYTILWLYFM